MKLKNLPFIMYNKNLNQKYLSNSMKKDRQPLPITKRVKGTIALLLATTMILSLMYTSDYLKTHENNVYATDSFTIMSQENELCRVRDRNS